MNSSTALVLFSGGQDSTICLAAACHDYDNVHTIGFDYGQAHHIELEARQNVIAALRAQFPQWDAKLASDYLLPLSGLETLAGSPLIEGGAIEELEGELPTSFVPGRNLLFLIYAAAYAYQKKIDVLIGGMCETDYSGYPDCRRDAIDAVQMSIEKGMGFACRIETPLMFMSKADSWAWAHELGGDAFIALIIEHTHSCYYGVRDMRHDWGYGCGACGACRLRVRGFNEWEARA